MCRMGTSRPGRETRASRLLGMDRASGRTTFELVRALMYEYFDESEVISTDPDRRFDLGE